jgi:hypothetical protein
MSLIGATVGSWLTATQPRETVRRFYRQTRPFGWWKPLREELSPAERASYRKEHRNDQFALPFALLAQVALFMLPMQLVLHAFGPFFKTLPFFLLGALGMYWFWWRHLPAANVADADAK